MPGRNRTCRALTVALLGLLGLAPARAAAQDDREPPPWLDVANGQTQPQFDFAHSDEFSGSGRY